MTKEYKEHIKNKIARYKELGGDQFSMDSYGQMLVTNLPWGKELIYVGGNYYSLFEGGTVKIRSASTDKTILSV